MKLYNNKEEVFFNLRNVKVIGMGHYGKVYKISPDICLKIFKYNEENFKPEVFKILKELSLPNFYELHDFFTISPSSSFIKAYTAKYYLKEEIDILTTKTDYTLNSLYSLYNAFVTLTLHNIWTKDTHSDNIIYQKDKIIIIDTDMYSINRFHSPSHLMYLNMKALSFLFSSLYFEALEKNYYSPINMDLYRGIIYDLFTIRTIEDVDRTCTKLAEYQYPIDYIRKTRKKCRF